MPGGYTSFYRPPPTPTGNPSLPGMTSPYPAPPTTAPLPPPPTNYQLPPPPAIPTLPSAPTNPFPALPPEILNLLGASKTAALAGLEQFASRSQGELLGDLFGRNMPRSSNAIDRANELSNLLGVSRANIEADAANRQLGAQQQAGQYGLNSFQAAVQALLGQGSLAQQGYANQTGNILQQQGLAQTGQIQQQQMLQQWAQMLMDYFNRQQMMSSPIGGSSSGGGGVGGPASFFGGGSAPTQSNPEQAFYDWLQRYIFGG